jgi:SAM-dependent methyltransferase
MKFEEYLDYLRRSEDRTYHIGYIGLDKDEGVISYLEEHTYRYQEIIKSIPRSPSPIRVLDIGTTPFTIFLKENYPHFEVSTLDITPIMKERCQASGIKFAVCDLARQPIPFPDNYFDLVIFTEVLEHLFALPSEVLKEIRRVMRAQGKLILSVPNFASLIKRIKLLLGINPLPAIDDQVRGGGRCGYGHIREYTMGEIVPILKVSEFTILKKKFLQPSVIGAFREFDKKGFRALLTGIYYMIGLLVPAFRATIYIECRAAKPN